MSRPTALFVSDAHFLDPGRWGGVQRCTQEYVALLDAAGLDVQPHPVRSTRRLGPRVRVRLGVEAYNLYDTARLLPGVIAAADAASASVVALNQMNLIGLAPGLRVARPGVRVVMLSHGNESGDFLHEALADGHPSVRDEWRLGRMLARESRGLQHVDAVLCLSETEAHINRWLGTAPPVVVPRTWTPAFLDHAPIAGRVGFVGTLDHRPNTEGVGRLLSELDALGVEGVELRLVGGPPDAGPRLASRSRLATYLGPLTPDELTAEARTWSASLNPVWWTSRGASTKLAEAIAWGLPVLTTTAGMRGYEWRDGHVTVVDTPAAMAREIVALRDDPERVRQAAAAVRRVAASGPTLDEIAARVRPFLSGHTD